MFTTKILFLDDEYTIQYTTKVIAENNLNEIELFESDITNLKIIKIYVPKWNKRQTSYMILN